MTIPAPKLPLKPTAMAIATGATALFGGGLLAGLALPVIAPIAAATAAWVLLRGGSK